VITTHEQPPLLAVAHRMFSRWRQENVFRYMRHEFALDHLCTQQVEPAHPERLVTSPERTRLEGQLRAVRADLARLVERRLDLAPGKTVRSGTQRVDEDGLDRLIQQREVEAARLSTPVATLPTHVPIGQVLAPDQVVQLERERKVVVDAIKLTAYRAETSLARLVEPCFERHEEEARKLLTSIFNATADLVPDVRARRLTIGFHGLASPRATRALGELCALLNQHETVYPGTTLRLRFAAPTLQE